MDSPKEIFVVGAAILHNGRCLVARRAPHVSNPGDWEFPGGKVEPDETPEAALEREIAEELGLVIKSRSFLGRGQSESGGRRIILDVFAAELQHGALQMTDHDEIRWVGPQDLASLNWAAADLPVLPALKALLLASG